MNIIPMDLSFFRGILLIKRCEPHLHRGCFCIVGHYMSVSGFTIVCVHVHCRSLYVCSVLLNPFLYQWKLSNFFAYQMKTLCLTSLYIVYVHGDVCMWMYVYVRVCERLCVYACMCVCGLVCMTATVYLPLDYNRIPK